MLGMPRLVAEYYEDFKVILLQNPGRQQQWLKDYCLWDIYVQCRDIKSCEKWKRNGKGSAGWMECDGKTVTRCDEVRVIYAGSESQIGVSAVENKKEAGSNENNATQWHKNFRQGEKRMITRLIEQVYDKIRLYRWYILTYKNLFYKIRRYNIVTKDSITLV